MRRAGTLLLVGLAAVLAPSAAGAGILFFTERSAWEAAAGAPLFEEDFSGFTEDTSFRTSAVALDGMTIQQVGSDTFRNEIDVEPDFDFTEHDGSNHASLFTNAPGGTNPEIQVEILFDLDNLAFGFDSWVAADQEGARLEVWDGGLLLGFQDLDNGFGAFLGYVLGDGDSATHVRFRSVSSLTSPGDPGEGFGLDGLAGVPVPEPGTALLLGGGLLALAALRRAQPLGRMKPA